MTSLPAADCSRSLLLQSGTRGRRWFDDVSVVQPDLPRHGCNSDRDPAASGGPTVLANDRNGRRLRLNALRHDDDDDW